MVSPSKRVDDFPEIIQHDTPLSAAAMGGVLLDLKGRVIGLNIARLDRVTTFALPGELVGKVVGEVGGRGAPGTGRLPAGQKGDPESAREKRPLPQLSGDLRRFLPRGAFSNRGRSRRHTSRWGLRPRSAPMSLLRRRRPSPVCGKNHGRLL